MIIPSLLRNCLSVTYSKCHYFKYSTAILGIETSCDDTGCAIINEDGQLLSETLFSQSLMSLRFGGIIPDVAQDFHRQNIEKVVSQTLETSRLNMENISAIAVTSEPGLPLSLTVGLMYAKHLAKHYKKPLIPIHHMQAHALAVRMEHEINFPYLVLLISGGHCLLAVVQDVNQFLLLGESSDCAPGEIFDKVARRLKLRNVPEYSKLCGGQAVELAARKATNPTIFDFPLPLTEYRDCNFSFNGLKSSAIWKIKKKEQEHNIVAHNLIPEANDLCSALLKACSRHLIHRTQRAIEFCDKKGLLPNENKQLVVSGGVARNDFIFNALSKMCEELELNIYRPKDDLCTDNGVMIAWNGLEKWRKNIDIVNDFKHLDIKSVSPVGKSLINEVKEFNLPVKLMKLKL